MLNPYDHDDAEPLKQSLSGMLDELSDLIAGARQGGHPIIYVNDHHGDWSAGSAEIAQRALAGTAPELVELVLPPDQAPFIVKARHLIFYQTLLEHLLRREEIDRLVLAGQVTEQCILYSALDGYLRNFQVVIATKAVAHICEELATAALQMMETNMHAEMAACADDVFAGSRS